MLKYLKKYRLQCVCAPLFKMLEAMFDLLVPLVVASIIDKGIGGFRLDVADELSDDFIEGIKERLCESTSDAVLYGEVWEDASNKIAYGKRRAYYHGRELDGVMNYPLRTGIVSYLREGRTDALRYALCEVLPNAPKRIADRSAAISGIQSSSGIFTASPPARTNKP